MKLLHDRARYACARNFRPHRAHLLLDRAANGRHPDRQPARPSRRRTLGGRQARREASTGSARNALPWPSSIARRPGSLQQLVVRIAAPVRCAIDAATSGSSSPITLTRRSDPISIIRSMKTRALRRASRSARCVLARSLFCQGEQRLQTGRFPRMQPAANLHRVDGKAGRLRVARAPRRAGGSAAGRSASMLCPTSGVSPANSRNARSASGPGGVGHVAPGDAGQPADLWRDRPPGPDGRTNRQNTWSPTIGRLPPRPRRSAAARRWRCAYWSPRHRTPRTAGDANVELLVQPLAKAIDQAPCR